MKRALAPLALVAAWVGLGCDATPRSRDASAPLSYQHLISIRIDAPSGGAPSVSVLAFRALVTGGWASDVLGLVDPLVAAAPETRCELRDVTAAARLLRAQGGAVELEALANVALELTPGGALMRPAPRVYPQLAAVVGGVIGEAGPLDVATLPERILVAIGEGDAREVVPVPLLPRLLDASGTPLASSTRLDSSRDLELTLAEPKSFLEIRPFGAPMALACPAGDGGRVVVPHDLLERLLATSGHVPVSIEAVWRRDSRLLQVPSTRLSLEARAAIVLDLRP